MTATTTRSGTSYGSPFYRAYVLGLLTLIYTLNFIDRNLINVIAQPIIAEFGLSDSEFGFLSGPPFAIFYAFMGLPIAALADRYRRVWIIAICIAIWSVMAALCGFAISFAALLLARIGVAIGEAGCTPPANSLISDYFAPRRRAAALAIFATGITLGAALSNYFGGPIARDLNGAALAALFARWDWQWLLQLIDWSQVAGWRVAFVAIGAPGLLIGLLALLTIREPPRGGTELSRATRREIGLRATWRELKNKPAYWNMAVGAAVVSLAGYGLVGFQAPLAQRVHGIDAATFSIQFGGPLALFAALGTFAGGVLVDRLTPRLPRAVAIVPAIGMALAVPLYIVVYLLPTDYLYSLAQPLWFAAAFCHYTYLGSQYAIGQGVVSERSRASAIAILLLLIAIVGNGLGPQVVGWMSDAFYGAELARADVGSQLIPHACRTAEMLAAMSESQQAACRAAYGTGLRHSMIATTALFLVGAFCFWRSSRTLERDLVV